MNTDAPVNVRLGIAYCYYNVDRIEDAKKTFMVILKMVRIFNTVSLVKAFV